MKKIITLAFLATGTLAFAQEIKVRESNESFSTGSNNAFVVTIYESSKDDVMSAWKSELKDFKYEKVKANGNEIIGDNILVKDWGNNPSDFYTKFDEDKDKKTVTMAVAVDLGGAYLKSGDNKEKAKFLEKFIKDFAVKITKDAIQDKMKEQEKALSKLEDAQKDLEKENKNSKSDIEDYKAKIKKAEGEIKTNEEAQVKKKAEIETQKKVVAEVKKKLDAVN
ncbi:MAG: hypothetical protein ACXVPQ_07300 [Bacteroidia bacterium]